MNYLMCCLLSVFFFVILESLGKTGIVEEKLREAWCRSLNETEIKCKSETLPDFKNKTINQPYLHCKDTTTLTFKWAFDHDTIYFLEAITEDDRIFTSLSFSGNSILQNLKPWTNYSVRLWAISSFHNLVGNSNFLSVSTRKTNVDPLPVEELLIANLTLTNDKYKAILKWTPANDLSCFYDIVWFGANAEYKQKEITEPSTFQVEITDLELNTNYSVAIMAKSGDWHRESPKTWIHIKTPSCLESFRNLNKCPPPSPKNVTISESLLQDSIYDVKISWLQEYEPDYYIIHIMNLIPANLSNTQSLNISGNTTEVTLEGIELGVYYQLILTAWSLAGSSDPVVIDRHVKGIKAKIVIDSYTSLILIIVLSLFVTLMIIAFLYFLNYRKLKKRNFEEYNAYFENVEKYTENTSITENLDEWETDVNKVELQTILGEGAFGIVRKASLNNNEKSREVAVKMLKDSPNSEEIRQFHQEIDIMKSVGCHPHLVSIIGCVTKGRVKQPLLIVEYCSKGNLQNYLRTAWDKLINNLSDSNDEFGNNFSNKIYELHSEDGLSIQPKDLMSFARQIVIGMEYLSKMRVVHRDLAARNILVCDDCTVKISDFGLSRDVYQNNVYCKISGGKLPMRWMALECLTHQRYTTKSDVWSFGVLLWEIVTLGGNPYPGISTNNLLALLKDGYRMDCPVNCSCDLYEVMQTCWKTSPTDRPTFAELRVIFDKLLEEVGNYLDLDGIKYDLRLIDKLEEESSCEKYIKPINICNFSLS